MKKKVVGIIPARFASSRFPGKLLEKILDKSLIQHTFEQSSKCKTLDALFIATDHEKIAHHVISFGGKALMTDVSCVNGTHRILDALKKYPELAQYEIVINIQGDHPAISNHTLTNLVSLLLEEEDALIATAACPVYDEEIAQDPNRVKCLFDCHQNALYFSRSPIPYYTKNFSGPRVYYQHMGLYAYKKQFLKLMNKVPLTTLAKAEDLEQLAFLEEGFKVKIALGNAKELVSVDVPEDISKAEKALLETAILNF